MMRVEKGRNSALVTRDGCGGTTQDTSHHPGSGLLSPVVDLVQKHPWLSSMLQVPTLMGSMFFSGVAKPFGIEPIYAQSQNAHEAELGQTTEQAIKDLCSNEITPESLRNAETQLRRTLGLIDARQNIVNALRTRPHQCSQLSDAVINVLRSWSRTEEQGPFDRFFCGEQDNVIKEVFGANARLIMPKYGAGTRDGALISPDGTRIRPLNDEEHASVTKRLVVHWMREFWKNASFAPVDEASLPGDNWDRAPKKVGEVDALGEVTFTVRDGIPLSEAIASILENLGGVTLDCDMAVKAICYAVARPTVGPIFDRYYPAGFTLATGFRDAQLMQALTPDPKDPNANLLLVDFRKALVKKKITDYLSVLEPGMLFYAFNAHVHPSVSHWLGENGAIESVRADGEPLVLGLGMKAPMTIPDLLKFLDTQRKPGATEPAYLTGLCVHFLPHTSWLN